MPVIEEFRSNPEISFSNRNQPIVQWNDRLSIDWKSVSAVWEMQVIKTLSITYVLTGNVTHKIDATYEYAIRRWKEAT